MRVDKIEVPDFKSEETIEDINKVIENKIQSKGRNSDSWSFYMNLNFNL